MNTAGRRFAFQLILLPVLIAASPLSAWQSADDQSEEPTAFELALEQSSQTGNPILVYFYDSI